jgi:hypothetical protein
MSNGEIHRLIPEVMKKLGAVGKHHRNPQQNYEYRAIDDVMAALQPLMAEVGLYAYPVVQSISHEQVLIGMKKTPMMHVFGIVEYHLRAGDGSEVVTSAIAEATDTADKAGPKAMASALKYAMTQTFMVPTDEVKDSEASHPELAQGAAPAPETADDFL